MNTPKPYDQPIILALPRDAIFTIIDGLLLASEHCCIDCEIKYENISDILQQILDKESPDWVDRLDDMLRGI